MCAAVKETIHDKSLPTDYEFRWLARLSSPTELPTAIIPQAASVRSPRQQSSQGLNVLLTRLTKISSSWEGGQKIKLLSRVEHAICSNSRARHTRFWTWTARLGTFASGVSRTPESLCTRNNFYSKCKPPLRETHSSAGTKQYNSTRNRHDLALDG